MKQRARRNRFEEMDPEWMMKLFLCYIQWCIGTLSEADDRELEKLTPQLRAELGCSGDAWYEVMEEGYGLPASGRKILMDCWLDMKDEVAPEDFVSKFAGSFIEKIVRKNRNRRPRFNH